MNKRWYLKNLYDLTPEAFEAILAAQGGGCAVCGTTSPTGQGNTFHVDHDHSCCPGGKTCGKCVRGILCTRCNMALGLLDDDRTRIARLDAYLSKTGVMQRG